MQNKLRFGYLLVAALTLAVSGYTFAQSRVLEQRVLLGERIAELFDTVLEIRRFERNYFLHGQATDQAENARYLQALGGLLDAAEADFRRLGIGDGVGSLRASLASYAQWMRDYVAVAPGDEARRDALQAQIREVGKRIVGVAEVAAGAERSQVQVLLASFRTVLVAAIVGLALLMIGIGQALSWRLVRPLKRLEEGVAAIQAGRRETLPWLSDDRELVAVVGAFNQLLQELRQRQRHLLRAEKLAALGTLLSGVAHELNNPLSNIWSSCQILLEELDEAQVPGHRGLLLQIDGQCERARAIVRSLLDFARDRPVQMQPVDLRGLILETLAFLKAEVPAGVRIEVEIPTDLRPLGDRRRLQQACLNLIRNAVQAVGASGLVRIAAHRTRPGDPFPVACPGAGDMIELLVSDSGPGIDAAVLPRIFDPFFTTKEVGHGMGLGLYIVYQIVDEHGGCISAGNAPGQGAVLRLRLPVAAGEGS
ncbi:ATP-binding protein [uncultured Thiodictyon sp.]|uniref:sensor histidine kinase n=1 Tax=uncultured Thiodictyon sp. TaxID=1846217 RepID=UPI0025FA189C|nr:ATP-binding protein [uncultured Thiodictyon sp.]